MATKHKADEVNDRVPGISAISGIKPEPSDDDTDRCDVDSKEPIEMSELESPTTSGNVEQVFIKKEDDPDAGGIASISIKSEPPGDEWDKCIAEDKSILEMETENYKLDLEMSGKVKPELLIKKEWDNDPAAVYEVSASRIKKDADELEAGPAGGVKEEADMEDDEDYQLTEDCDIKSESGASMDAASDVPSNSIEKSIITKNQDQDIYESVGSKSLSCYICNYTAFSKDHLIDHMIVHKKKKYVLDHTKGEPCNANASVSSETDKFWTCDHCDVIFRVKRGRDQHIIRKHPDSISSVTSKLHECTKCSFKTVTKKRFDRHLLKHPEVASDFKHSICIHCNATFKSKYSLDEHVVRKHPDFMTSVTSKLHECTKCSFKTVTKKRFDRHLLKHPEVASNFKHSICIHCSATFKSKYSLDEHVVRKHPDFITSVTSKLHECTKCTFKTVKKLLLDNHVLRKHPDIVSSVTSKLYECTKCTFKTVIHRYFYKHLLEHSEHRVVPSDVKLLTCIHCNATFKAKLSLDDHVVRKHPDFITTVTRKIYECPKCPYKTIYMQNFERHMSGPIRCIHCNLTFKRKSTLDDHLVRKHPDCVSSVTSKIHECIKCGFKAIKKRDFNRHLQKHSEIASDFKPTTCIHCNVTLASKATLDNHVVRKHPDFIETVASKIHECPKCTYKTTFRNVLQKHMSAHPEHVSGKTRNTCTHCSASFRSKAILQSHMSDHLKKGRKLFRCVHCNAAFTRKARLDEHIIKKHPDFISSVTTKLHACTKCTFKTVRKCSLDSHLLEHPEVASDGSSKQEGP